MSLTCPQLKRTLRQLRQLELTLRFGQAPAPDHPPLVWDVFFSTKAADSRPVKYPLSHLLQLEREEFKAILDEYFARIYAQTADGQSLTQADVYDPRLLARLGLPPDADGNEVKRQFRALAKQYHPDLGGESTQFVELVALYESLTDGPR
jgi:DnaJ domain